MRDEQHRKTGSRVAPRTAASRGTRSKRSILNRTIVLMVCCGVLMFIPLGWKLWDIAIVHHEEYQKRASDQWTLDMSVAAQRGNIYDQNGHVLAMSSTVYTLIVSPNDLVKSIPEKDEEGNVLSEETRAELLARKQDQLVDDLMTLMPDLDRERVDQQVRAVKYSYREIKKNIEEEEHDRILQYITENETRPYLYMNPGTKRYYPYSGLAAQALGYVNDNGGAVGLEAVYNDILEGTSGRIVTTRTSGVINDHAQYIDAVDGYDLTLTIDATIQSYLEKTLEEGIRDYNVLNGAFGVVMDPKTGAIRAIASSPDFDPNNYSLILDDLLNSKAEQSVPQIFDELKANNTEGLSDEELMSKAKDQAYYNAFNTQSRSKAINDTYEPGSTFKAIVLAAALEEGVVSESDHFYCSGSVRVGGHTISCSKREGHGDQTLAKAVGNSCNPAFIEIGQRLGVEKFWEYFQAFGMTEVTGIDLPGEEKGINWGANMSITDLAVASFGQRFQVTPMQMIRAFAAVINGGDLVRPYLVQSIADESGAVIQNTQPEIVRQVVSRQTSQRATDILEKVVSEGTGGNAYVAGYRIGGKTGSSETTQSDQGRTIVSFMGFAPADDPEVIVLIAYDWPEESPTDKRRGTCGVFISGGNMAAPKAGPLIAQILDYMGVEKEYTAAESAAVDVKTPRVTGKTVLNAQTTLIKQGLKFRTIGEGDTVSRQIPAAGEPVPGGATVILYLGDAVPEETGTIPNVEGMTYEAAKHALEQAGFFMRASGVSVYYGNTSTAESQSLPAGETAAIGTIVDVRFFNVVEDGAVATPD